MDKLNHEKKSLIIASSPHFRSNDCTSKIMLRVLIALVPLILAVAFIYGSRIFLSLAVAGITALISEYLIQKAMHRKVTVKDLSALVTAIILVLNLPVDFPLWQLILGTIFAIIVVKAAFGGIGQNFANPAITARIVLVSSFSASFMKASRPLERAIYYSIPPAQAAVTQATSSASIDATSGATILSQIKPDADLSTIISARDLLFGIHNTSAVGETCIIAILIGGLFLLLTKTIKVHIPLSFIGTVALLSLLHSHFDWQYTFYQLTSGGLLFGAFFIATDYTTSPLTNKGKIVFGIGLGLITVLIRFYGNLPEGVSFAILTMNILTPHIDRLTGTKYFGSKKRLRAEHQTEKQAKA